MTTTRHLPQLDPAQLQQVRQARATSIETVELNVEELEERIAPATRPITRPY
jgi:hypothetical protein